MDVRLWRTYGGGEGSLRQMSSLEGGEATGEVECKTKGFHRDEYRRGRFAVFFVAR